jgi:hypothetical protein
VCECAAQEKHVIRGAIKANTAYAKDSRWAPFSLWTFLFLPSHNTHGR